MNAPTENDCYIDGLFAEIKRDVAKDHAKLDTRFARDMASIFGVGPKPMPKTPEKAS